MQKINMQCHATQKIININGIKVLSENPSVTITMVGANNESEYGELKQNILSQEQLVDEDGHYVNINIEQSGNEQRFRLQKYQSEMRQLHPGEEEIRRYIKLN